MPLFFHTEDLEFELPNPNLIEKWVSKIISNEQCKLGDVNLVFTSNDYLLKINQDYLNHHYYTDVITFNYNVESVISGDIFVSLDQIKINAKDFVVTFEDELYRVIIHGILHLIGYDDKDDLSQAEMTKMENASLTLLEEIIDGKNI